MDLQKQLDLFFATPPRLFPHQPEQRAIIEQQLITLAASDPDRYEEKFALYNQRCDELGVPRFGRVTIVKEVVPTPPLPVVEAPAQEETPVVESAPIEVPTTEEVPEAPKKRKKKSLPPTA